MTDPKYAPGQTVNGRLICGAKRKTGDPCGAPPPRGATRCRNHGGKSPQAQAKARERNIEAEARQVLGKIDPTAPTEHPVEMLMKLIQMKWAEVVWLRAKVADYTEEELTWGRTEHKTGVGPEGPVDVETFKAEANIWWRLLREAENQLATWTAAAAKAGVDERLTRVSEQTANQFVTALNAILDALTLTDLQREQVPVIVPRILRSISN